MNIDHQLMTQITRLARLRLDEQEMSALQKDLQVMLGYVASLQSLELADAGDDSLDTARCPERPDEAEVCDTERAIRGFPQRRDRLLVVPRIVDGP